MQYPEHLLPRSNFKYIVDSDDWRLCTLVRHTRDQTIFLEGTNTLNPEVLTLEVPSSQLHDLSTNLLGIFKVEDVSFSVINSELLKLWAEGEDMPQPLIEGQDFSVLNGRGYFYFSIKEVLDLAIPGGIKEVPVSFGVLHTPTKSNFWHFSIRVFSGEVEVNNLDISDSKKRKIWKGIKDFLTTCAFVDSENHPVLAEPHYCK